MSDLRELYQEMILDHGKHPRNFAFPDPSSHGAEGHNPLCGDKLSLRLRLKDDVIEDIGFQGSGCAIFTASTSTMTEAVKGKHIEQANQLFSAFHQLVAGSGDAGDARGDSAQSSTTTDDELGKLMVFSGVAEFPMRVKCATLAWHTLMAALQNQQVASTE